MNNKLKKVLLVSAAALVFLLVASLIAYLFGFVESDYEYLGWVYVGVGVAALVASGVLAFAVKGRSAVNIACFAANSVALGLCIRGWYELRGLENSFLTMFFVCLACIAYLWVFFLLCLIPFISRHITPFFFIWLGISAVAYILVVIFTTTTFVSTFGYYMLIGVVHIRHNLGRGRGARTDTRACALLLLGICRGGDCSRNRADRRRGHDARLYTRYPRLLAGRYKKEGQEGKNFSRAERREDNKVITE